MVETRIEPRYRASKAATIEFVSGAIDCMVRDLSITVSSQSLSITTALTFPHQLQCRCSLHFMRRTVAYGPPFDDEACADSRQPALSPAMSGSTRALQRLPDFVRWWPSPGRAFRRMRATLDRHQ